MSDYDQKSYINMYEIINDDFLEKTYIFRLPFLRADITFMTIVAIS